ncbi:hypothetical protein [Oryza sativa Japonica Group]|nr:hypothetical protein [Oryza sativa Japonica Group]
MGMERALVFIEEEEMGGVERKESGAEKRKRIACGLGPTALRPHMELHDPNTPI